ncbi:MAG TPA: Gfo/Idh/MocA family oxidoreductase [Polyangiales bacterium]
MKIGVIGAGAIGELRGQSVRNNAETDLAFMVDVDRAVSARVADKLDTTAYVDYRQAIDVEKPDAVIVSSPVQLHEEMCKFAFDAGCHVLCEKPLSSSSAAARRIYDAAKAARKTLGVGFNHRYYPSMRFVKDCIREGRLGELDHLRVFGGHDGLKNFRQDWMFKAELSGGGAMMDVGIHMTDLARYLVGEISEVYAITSERIWHVPGSEDNAIAVFKTASGLPVSYQATWDEWKGYRVQVEAYGSLGMVRGYYAPMFNLLVTHDKPGGPRKRQVKLYPEIVLREKLKGWQTTTQFTFEGELADFLRMIEGQPVDLADAWSGVRSVEIAEATYASSKQGTVQHLSTPPAG